MKSANSIGRNSDLTQSNIMQRNTHLDNEDAQIMASDLGDTKVINLEGVDIFFGYHRLMGKITLIIPAIGQSYVF